MASKNQTYTIKGMQRDLSVSKFNPEYAYENYNIRITSRGNKGSLLSVTNERGTKVIPSSDLGGTFLGGTTLNNYLILFTINKINGNSEIIRYNFSQNPIERVVLFSGNIGFNINNPIEALPLYETDTIQKVYWVDGINQPRVINILKVYNSTTISQIEFSPNLPNTVSNIDVKKDANGNGTFSGGSLQYAYSYYIKNGSETSIINTSSLVYPSIGERACSPEESSTDSFNISISDIPTGFDFIRLYSIMRTSEGATPTVKKVIDLSIKNTKTIAYTDSGRLGEILDPTVLLYIGGSTLYPNTLSSKDNTLFLGNYTVDKLSKLTVDTKDISITLSDKTIDNILPSGYLGYRHKNQLQLSSKDIKYFRASNYYRFGFQVCSKTGEWSDPIFIKDFQIPAEGRPSHTWGQPTQITYPVVHINLAQPLIEDLVAKGYLYIRPLAVFPSSSDRTVVAQGILCPTLYSAEEKNYISSWFTRQKLLSSGVEILNSTLIIGNSYSGKEFRHNNRLPVPGKSSAEVQCATDYTVTNDIVSFYSPETTFGYLQDLTNRSLSLNIVGTSNIENTSYAYDLQADTLFHSNSRVLVNPTGINSDNRCLGLTDVWFDYALKWVPESPTDPEALSDKMYKYLVFPWHRKGSLNNCPISEQGRIRKSILKYKKLSNLVFGGKTYYFKSPLSYSITDPSFFEQETSGWAPITGETEKKYLGDYDKVLTPKDPYDIYLIDGGGGTEGLTIIKQPKLNPDGPTPSTGIDPIPIRFRSTSHHVIKFLNGKTLPRYSGGPLEGGADPFENTQYINGSNAAPTRGGYLLVGDLVQIVDKDILFGGTSLDALKNNKWLVVGDTQAMIAAHPITLIASEGDTYHQRFDCLKTYPYSLEELNAVTDLFSCMCETYINIDGRYDRNRGAVNNLSIFPRNFNLINKGYNQENNFFSSRIIDQDSTSFKNSIIWSRQKALGEDVDTWANISTVSNLDLDGEFGKVTSIKKLGNDIFSFQDRAISKILFNSRVQVQTSESVPIEISNSYKVDGKIYLSNVTGCQNKWSIVTTTTGLYFIDNLTNSLYRFDGQQLDPLSDKLGFRTFIEDQNSNEEWVSTTQNNFRGFYDSTNGDVYFINKSYCLGYSELLNQFTSFYSYEKSPYMFNMLGSFYSIDPDNTFIWKHENGDYNTFYNAYKPYSISIIGNPDFQLDKIYTNLDYRADVFLTDSNTLVENETFTKFSIEDTYQKVAIDLLYKPNNMSNIKRRFRTWRIQIPRSTIEGRGFGRDRIRNNWAKFTLTSNKSNDKNRIELHDINLNYFV